MSEKNYIEAMNEIKVSNKRKKEVLEKMKEKNNKKWISLSLCTACIAVIAVGILIPIKILEKNNKIIEPQKDDVRIAQTLPNVKNYEELYSAFKERQKDNDIQTNTKGIVLESAVTDTVTSSNNEESQKNSEYSDTNVQVEGVDEADIVKTDGDYIYYLADNNIIIVNTKDVKNLSMSYKISFDEEKYFPKEMYIQGNKLIIIGQEFNDSNYYDSIYKNSIYYGRNEKTTAKIYNIENKEDVQLEREVKIDGNYLTSRMIGNNLYLIANKFIYSICNQYKKEELKEEELLPCYTDTAISSDSKNISYDCIYCIPKGESSCYLNIASFNVNEKKEANITSYIGAGEDVYCSEENLYVASTKYEYNYSVISGITNNYQYKINTNIYKFNLNNDIVKYVCEGEVPGAILNQFSMDESNGNFRIATTNSTSWNNETNTNNLYILNADMNIIGKVENLAPGERIYSVRFMGNRAYMVTFVQTDPLFVIDLSDPTNPTVLGELKIPGFSNYLHPYDENHIIGFGQNTETVNYGYGEVVKTAGMKMGLFDVTDPTNPKEMYSIKIGDRGTYSELLDNHKALLFSKEKNLLAFPISITKESNNNYYNYELQGAIVYNIDLENGFTEKGIISHKENQGDIYFSYDYEKYVERIIYINDELITLSPRLIKVTDMNTMKKISELEIK